MIVGRDSTFHPNCRNVWSGQNRSALFIKDTVVKHFSINKQNYGHYSEIELLSVPLTTNNASNSGWNAGLTRPGRNAEGEHAVFAATNTHQLREGQRYSNNVYIISHPAGGCPDTAATGAMTGKAGRPNSADVASREWHG